MEKSKKPLGTLDQDELEAAQMMERSKKIKQVVLGLSCAVAAVVIVLLIVMFVRENGQKNAQNAANDADRFYSEQLSSNPLAADSLALPMYLEAADKGYKNGSRAAAQAAIMQYKAGKYQEALDLLNKADFDDVIVAAGVNGLKGDCNVNLGNNEAALKNYDKAISIAKGNPQIEPYFLVKKAVVYRAMGDFNNEYNAYQQVANNYPNYGMTDGRNINIQKYMERAKASAGK